MKRVIVSSTSLMLPGAFLQGLLGCKGVNFYRFATYSNAPGKKKHEEVCNNEIFSKMLSCFDAFILRDATFS